VPARLTFVFRFNHFPLSRDILPGPELVIAVLQMEPVRVFHASIRWSPLVQRVFYRLVGVWPRVHQGLGDAFLPRDPRIRSFRDRLRRHYSRYRMRELNELRNQLRTALSGVETERQASATELAEKSLQESKMIGAAPQWTAKRSMSAEELVTARIRRQLETPGTDLEVSSLAKAESAPRYIITS
jgi:hypothetical protein